MMVCVGSVLLKKLEYKQRVESLRSNDRNRGGGWNAFSTSGVLV